MADTEQGAAQRFSEALDRLRASGPVVQNIPNYVSMDIAANALLALGASPAMVHAPEELAEFGAFIGALSINIGTLSGSWVESMVAAAALAHKNGKPWVLDPVGAGATRFRNEAVVRLAPHRPTVVRGNASEIMAVGAALGLSRSAARPKGVDSTDSTDDAQAVASELARHLGCVVVATGAVDVVTDGTKVRRIANGSPLMTKVTAVGCSLSAIVAAFCAIEPDAFEASSAAVAITGIAGEVAAEQTQLPGSFRTAWMDQLAAVDGTVIARYLRLRLA